MADVLAVLAPVLVAVIVCPAVQHAFQDITY